jgi:hypothetical protein
VCAISAHPLHPFYTYAPKPSELAQQEILLIEGLSCRQKNNLVLVHASVGNFGPLPLPSPQPPHPRHQHPRTFLTLAGYGGALADKPGARVIEFSAPLSSWADARASGAAGAGHRDHGGRAFREPRAVGADLEWSTWVRLQTGEMINEMVSLGVSAPSPLARGQAWRAREDGSEDERGREGAASGVGDGNLQVGLCGWV